MSKLKKYISIDVSKVCLFTQITSLFNSSKNRNVKTTIFHWNVTSWSYFLTPPTSSYLTGTVSEQKL